MRVSNVMKAALVSCILWIGPDAFSQQDETDATPDGPQEKGNQTYDPDDYVGSESCGVCHEEIGQAFLVTVHAKLDLQEDRTMDKKGCESCHGPGAAHMEELGEDVATQPLIRIFKNLPSKETSKVCLQCHGGEEEHNNFTRGEHWRNDVGCIDCHAPHPPDASTRKLLAKPQKELCVSCHTEVDAQFSLPFHHKVPEGAMACSDCHTPHGGFELKQTRLATGTDISCLKCHTDKQGPFVFEHAPLRLEGCPVCHDPHGSANPKLLKRSNVNQLCLECHSNAGTIGAPNTPGFHNQQDMRFQNCTTCHVKIHGSNVEPFFIR